MWTLVLFSFYWGDSNYTTFNQGAPVLPGFTTQHRCEEAAWNMADQWAKTYAGIMANRKVKNVQFACTEIK